MSHCRVVRIGGVVPRPCVRLDSALCVVEGVWCTQRCSSRRPRIGPKDWGGGGSVDWRLDHSGGADAPCLGGVWGEVGGQLVLACCTKLATQGRPPELHGAGEQFNL